MPINMIEIGFAGNGWGAKSALKGLLEVFDVKVYSSDQEILDMVNKSKHVHALIDLPDLVVFSGFTEILHADYLRSHDCINIHYSLLPKYRGLHSTVWAILNNEEFLGYSIHLIDEQIDHGDILFQKKFKNDMLTSAPDFIRIFNKDVEVEIASVVDSYLNGSIQPEPQDHSKATWVGKRGKKDCIIDFNRSGEYILNLFRCLQDPYPLPYIQYQGKDIQVKSAFFHPQSCDTHIGRVLNIDDRGIYVKCKDGYMVLSELSQGEEVMDHKTIKPGVYLN